MGGIGGLGSLGAGFVSGFERSRSARLARDRYAAQQELAAQKEKRLSEQFAQTQKFREDQAAALERYRAQTLGNQEEAAQALQTYRAGQLDLEQKKLDVAKKSADLQVMGAWEKILDPKLGKPQRKFMFKQLATTLQIDPKSQQYKDFEGMVTGMDDENLKETYSNLATLLPKATPGQVVAFSKAIISGQMQMKDAIEQFTKSGEADTMQKIMGGGATDGGTGEQTGVPTQQVQTSRIINPTPMAQQVGVAPNVRRVQGGTLPVPGMSESTGGGQPQSTDMTADEARSKAQELLKALPNSDNARASANALMQYARDKTDKFGLAVTVDENDPNNNVYTVYDKSNPAAALAGKEAPSSRNYPTPAEKAQEAEAVALAQADVKRLETFRADAETARKTAEPLTSFKQTMDQGGFTPGSFAGIRESVGRMAEFIGLPQEAQDALKRVGIGDPAAAETLSSKAAEISTGLAERLGRVSNMQLNFVGQIGPQAWKTPKGNDMIIDLAQRQNARALEIEAKIEEYQDAYGTMRPKGKPSVFQEINKIRAKPLVDDNWIKQFKDEARKGQGMKWEDLIAKTPKIKIGEQDFEQTGVFKYTPAGSKTQSSIPQVRLSDGNNYPYAASAKEFNALPPGTTALIAPPGQEPRLMTKD